MARVAGINIPDDKHTEVSLTYVFGIGKTRALEICSKTGITPSRKIGDLKEEELNYLYNHPCSTYPYNYPHGYPYC